MSEEMLASPVSPGAGVTCWSPARLKRQSESCQPAGPLSYLGRHETRTGLVWYHPLEYDRIGPITLK